MIERIKENLKAAMRGRDEVAVGTLRQLLAAISSKEKEKRFSLAKAHPDTSAEELDGRAKLSDEEILEVAAFEAKKRREAIQGFQKGGAQERADQEKRELEILAAYLPEQMSDEEIRNIVREGAESLGTSGPQDIGKIMAAVMPKVKGKAEGSRVREIAKEFFEARPHE